MTESQKDAVKKDERGAFRSAVERMVHMLEEGEWAEHVAESIAAGDELASRLESAITELHNDIGEAREPRATSTQAPAGDGAEAVGVADLPSFPTMLRKMWSGSEVQQWINDNIKPLVQERHHDFHCAAPAVDGMVCFFLNPGDTIMATDEYLDAESSEWRAVGSDFFVNSPYIAGMVPVRRMRRAAPLTREAATVPETSQFLADVMTAAGLVRHGRQSKALADRLSEGCMRMYGLPAASPAAESKTLPRESEGAGALTYPADFTDDLQWILGLMCFQCIQYARALRKGGRSIPSKAEAEQAATLDFLLRRYMLDPENWRKTAADELRAMAAEATGVVKGEAE